MTEIFSYNIETPNATINVELSGSSLYYKSNGELIGVKDVDPNTFGSANLKALAEKIALNKNGKIVA